MSTPPSDEELYNSVVEFVRSETRTRKQISNRTNILRDLGVDGDDATEFMLKFQDRFDVDLSNFNFDLHFGGEGFKLMTAIKSALGVGGKKAPITIATLYEAARERRWPGIISGFWPLSISSSSRPA